MVATSIAMSVTPPTTANAMCYVCYGVGIDAMCDVVARAGVLPVRLLRERARGGDRTVFDVRLYDPPSESSSSSSSSSNSSSSNSSSKISAPDDSSPRKKSKQQ